MSMAFNFECPWLFIGLKVATYKTVTRRRASIFDVVVVLVFFTHGILLYG